MLILKEDTAVDIKLGPFVDKGDGVAYEVGMAAAMDHATTGIRLSKNGGAFADRTEATEPSYDAFGYYLVKLDATDTNTPGRLRVIFGDAAVCLPCEANFMVVNANVFDSLYGAAAADYLQVDVKQLLGTAWLAPGTAGTPDVNAKLLGGTAQTGNDVGADVNTLPNSSTLNSHIITLPNSQAVMNAITSLDVRVSSGAAAYMGYTLEGTTTMLHKQRLDLAVLTGISSGGGTSRLVFRDIGDTKTRLDVTVDSNQNRTTINARDGS